MAEVSNDEYMDVAYLNTTKISADAMAYGLGAVLLQQHVDTWKHVAFASKSLSNTERKYSQIEKEALALVWVCEKFSLEMDHKPLVPLLGTTSLAHC